MIILTLNLLILLLSNIDILIQLQTCIFSKSVLNFKNYNQTQVSTNQYLLSQTMLNIHLKASSIATILILFFILIDSTSQTKAQFLTMETLKQLRTIPSFNHNFIIIDKDLLLTDKHNSIDHNILPLKTPSNEKIQYFYTDCEKKILQVCQQHRNVPIILIYNRVVIEYQMGWGDKFNQKYVNKNYNQKSIKEDIKQWVDSVIAAKVQKSITTKQQIEELIQEHQSVFVMVQNRSLGQNQLAYEILAKNYPTQKLVYFKDPQVAIKIQMDVNLTIGKFVHFTFNNQNHQFPLVPTPKLQLWESFILGDLFWSIDSLDASFTSNRFNHTIYSKQKQTLVFCDLSIKCSKYMKQLNKEIILSEQKSDYKFNASKIRKNIVESSSFKNPKIIQLYFHIKLTNLSMPLVLIINGESQQYPNIPVRYVKELNPKDNENLLGQIAQLWENIEEGNEVQQYLSAGIPKKNGFYGKGSERLMQKVTFQTYKQAILAAHQQNAIYLLYITAYEFDCPQCSENYAQLKKFASYLKAEGRDNIRFGVYDLSSNQIDLQSISGIPTLILFKPGSIDPQTNKENSFDQKIVTYFQRFSFENLMRFVQGNLPKQQIETEEL